MGPLGLVQHSNLGLCWAMPSISRAGEAGGGPDLVPAPERLPAGTAPHRALTAPRTPSPHPLSPAALGGLQSPGLFLTVACPSTSPRFMEFEAEDEIRMENLSCTKGVQGMPPPAPPKPAPQEPTSRKPGTRPVNHLPTGGQGKGIRGLGMATVPRLVLFPQGGIDLSTRTAPEGGLSGPLSLWGMNVARLETHHPPPCLRGPCAICLTCVLVGRPLVI